MLLNTLHRMGFSKDCWCGFMVIWVADLVSILGQVLFSLYMPDLQDKKSDCNYLQCGNDTSLYKHCKVKDLDTCCKEIGRELALADGWSTALRLNSCKTNMVIFPEHAY